jgi:hypothetical protein
MHKHRKFNCPDWWLGMQWDTTADCSRIIYVVLFALHRHLSTISSTLQWLIISSCKVAFFSLTFLQSHIVCFTFLKHLWRKLLNEFQIYARLFSGTCKEIYHKWHAEKFNTMLKEHFSYENQDISWRIFLKHKSIM